MRATEGKMARRSEGSHESVSEGVTERGQAGFAGRKYELLRVRWGGRRRKQ